MEDPGRPTTLGGMFPHFTRWCISAANGTLSPRRVALEQGEAIFTRQAQSPPGSIHCADRPLCDVTVGGRVSTGGGEFPRKTRLGCVKAHHVLYLTDGCRQLAEREALYRAIPASVRALRTDTGSGDEGNGSVLPPIIRHSIVTAGLTSYPRQNVSLSLHSLSA